MRAYMVSVEDMDESNEIVIADNSKEAKRIAWEESEFIQDIAKDSDGWISLRVSWCKKGDVIGLSKGVNTDYVDLLKRNIIGSIYGDERCPICNSPACLYKDDNGKVGCNDCLYKD